MKTVLTKSPAVAAEFIRNGGLAAFPTETVYGLGANVFDGAAVGGIFLAKKRPADNPLIAHVGDIGQIGLLATEIPETAHLLINKFFPGPLTVVLRKADGVPGIATAGLDSIGVRMPRNELAREFLKLSGTPVAAPSANLSGRPSPTTWQAVYEDLNGRIDCILQGEATEIGLESTVVDCTGRSPLILRSGAISLSQLREILPEITVYRPDSGEKPKSPGLIHRHYSPRAKVEIIPGDHRIWNAGRNAYIGVGKPDAEFEITKLCSSTDEYANSFFAFFRECDKAGIETIYCEAVSEDGIGAALMDRLRRAAEN